MESASKPYPGTVVEFNAWFPDDAGCLDYLARLLWGDEGFGCHLCDAVGRASCVPPCYLPMGLRGVETGDGVATLAMAKSPWLCNAFGVIYGGVIAYLADAERRCVR